MIGSSQRMPKRLRYPLFLLGLVIILIGSIEANNFQEGVATTAGVVALGFVLLLISVAVR
ncbi:MAG: hypothetical protein KGI38_04825 [Thaumarchaeota archaeon]|nr:hypothetical protein [Nitrososphaerota archaeon]